MNRDEFNEWFRQHAVAFPKWQDDVLGLDTAGETLDAWSSAMSDVSFEAARDASREMLAGDLKRPFTVSDHVTIIHDRAREIDGHRRQRDAMERAEIRDAAKCRVCRDTGYVATVHVQTIRAVRDGRYDAWLRDERRRFPMWYEAAVWCSCSRGAEGHAMQRRAFERDRRPDEGRANPPLPVYDPDQFCRQPEAHDRRLWIETVRQWMGDRKPANYCDDLAGFDSYQETQG